MPIEVTMPRLSDTMQAGTIVRWAVKEGAKVKSGDVVADIETDKATMELPVYDEGVIAHLAAPEGKQVPVGTLIAVIASAGESHTDVKATYASGAVHAGTKAVTTATAASSASAPAPAVRASAASGTALAEPPASNGHHDAERVFASPLARKIAAESGVDLASIRGSGPSGRIIRKDVEAAAASGSARRPEHASAITPAGAGLTGRIVPMSNMRRTIARRLVESKTTIPHYQVTVEVDMDALVALRTQLNEQLADHGVKLSVNDFLVRACALAMHRHPFVNSRWVGPAGEENIEQLERVNIGVAIALDESKGGGLVVATIRDADRVGLRQISAQSKALSEKARAKGLSLDEMADSTFTISNLGMFGVDHFTAIINPPNAAILAVGAAVQKPVVRAGQVVPGWVMSMTMSSDHRIIDGAMAAAYLNTVKGSLEKPATLLV
ncbi:MAG: 2-oxo acid dehydrogenase subunit E2 [Phycisphaeraceae bacterium]|nr:MAG: 2-oxo acid dehydrogenase subunit E2 [Phycisphaeraceae bacterium]